MLEVVHPNFMITEEYVLKLHSLVMLQTQLLSRGLPPAIIEVDDRYKYYYGRSGKSWHL